MLLIAESQFIPVSISRRRRQWQMYCPHCTSTYRKDLNVYELRSYADQITDRIPTILRKVSKIRGEEAKILNSEF